MSAITVLTLVPNAGDRLIRCLESVAWADDLFCVVDPATTDGSDAVARRYSRRVVVHEFENYSAQRNWAIAQIQTEWTLVLDADEWVSEELAGRIREIMNDPQAKDGYAIRRRSLFLGREMNHCGWERDYPLRLFRTPKGRYSSKRLHPHVVVEGSVGRLEEPMYHDTYRTLEEFFARLERFTAWNAQDAYDSGKRARLWDLTLRPLARFLTMYVIRQGFRDGYHGAVLCGLGAFSVFAKYAKLWSLERQERP